jgi:hypothetical protein
MNWTIVIIVGILGIAIVIYTLIRNQKDKKDLEKTLNNDFPKKPDQRGEIEEDFM